MEIQNKLFKETKGSLKEESFRELVNDRDLTQPIIQGTCQGFKLATSEFRPHRSLIHRAHTLNEDVFHCISENLNPLSGVHCYSSHSGNKRKVIVREPFLFIVNKSGGGTTNDTQTTKDILNQNLEHHVISIVYTVDDMWTRVTTVRFEYKYQNNILYSHTFLVGEEDFALNINTLNAANTVERIKPKLKIDTQKEAKEA